MGDPLSGIALSTMWSLGQAAPLPEAVRRGLEAGYPAVELNHQLSPQALVSLEPGAVGVTSVHDPCPNGPAHGGPSLASPASLASPDEDARRRAVRVARESLETAARYGGTVVVVHLGSVEELEATDRELVEVHRREGRSDHHQGLLRRLLESRRELAPSRVESALRSLRELQPHARRLGLRLAMENRAYLHEIPSLPEARELLDRLPPEVFGYWHDVGHAHRLESHGVWSQADWLEELGPRLMGMHLHDCRGTVDHLLPGQGEVDFARTARYRRPGLIRVAELRPRYRPDQIRAARQAFQAHGL